jgi:hypothetical protein
VIWHVKCISEGRSSTYLPGGMASLSVLPPSLGGAFSFFTIRLLLSATVDRLGAHYRSRMPKER